MKRARAGLTRPPAALAYGRIADIYNTSLRVFGFKRGVEQFLQRTEWRFPPRPRILDAGTGTGIIALWFLRRFPECEVVAFDIDEKMLAVLGRAARRHGHGPSRLTVARGDLRAPDIVTSVDTGRAVRLAPRSFDAVVVGAALEHVPAEASLERLGPLVRPGGTFLNLGVRPGPAGAMLARVYDFRVHPPAEIFRCLTRLGFVDVRVVRLGSTDFPANLSRIAVLGRTP